MSDNLINLIKSALFLEAVTVATDGGDISPTIIQPAQMTGQDKYNLDQRDSLSVLLFSDLGTITAGATITAKYYARFPNATTDSKLLSTEVITAPAITVGDHYAARFTGENLVNCDADYFTITVVLKQAVGSAYTVSGQVTVKKKIVDEPLTGKPAPVTYAKLLVDPVGVNNAIVFTARNWGIAGNLISIEYKLSAPSTASISVTVAGNAITVNLATDAGGALLNTSANYANAVIAAMNAKAEALALVSTRTYSTDTGATVVTVMPLTLLSGGLDPIHGYLDQVIYDTLGRKWTCVGDLLWEPYGFPDVDMLFPTGKFDAGYRVWKKKLTGVLTSTGTTTIPHNITNYNLMYSPDMSVNTTAANNILFNGYGSATATGNILMTSTNLTLVNGTSYFAGPFSAYLACSRRSS